VTALVSSGYSFGIFWLLICYFQFDGFLLLLW
jgi:hypothetical protein